MKRVITLLLATLLLASSGCISLWTDPMGRMYSLRMMQREYTNYVRWGRIEEASEFVDPAQRQDYLGFLPAFEKIRITDFEIGKMETNEDETEANVTVTYQGYSVLSMTENQIREKQEWFREGRGNNWRVRPEIAGIANAFEQAQR